MKKRHRIWGYLLLVVLFFLALAAIRFIPGLQQFSSLEYIKSLLLGLGGWGYLLFVVLLILSVPFPIPSAPIILLGGYLYGGIIGFILGLVGSALGALLSFATVRSLGEPVVEKMVDPHHIAHFNHIFARRGVPAALLCYSLPIFPSDTVSLLLGLTRIHLLTFIVVAVLGSIPRVLLINSLGEDLRHGFSMMTVLLLLLVAVFVLIAAFREKIKRFFFKELHELEGEAVKVEHEVEHELNQVEKDMEREFSGRKRKKKRASPQRSLKSTKRGK